MTAPTPTARTTPTGDLLENGYQCLITFATDPDVDLWEKDVTPVGVDGGEKIDITTQHNTTWKTNAPQSLLESTDGQFTCGYDPAVISQIQALINVRTTVTEHYPDGSSIAYFGYLRSFTKGALSNGTFPEGTAIIVATNVDPATGDEEDPVYTAPV